MRDYDAWLKEDNAWLADYFASSISKHSKDREVRITIWNVLEAVTGEEPGGSGAYIFNQTNFKLVEELCNKLEAAGIALEFMKVVNEPDAKAKCLSIELPSTEFYRITVYLGQNAECTLVEKERIPQPDKVVYDMICDEEPVDDGNGLEVKQVNDGDISGTGDEEDDIT